MRHPKHGNIFDGSPALVAESEHYKLLDRHKLTPGSSVYTSDPRWRWAVYDVSERNFGEYAPFTSKKAALASMQGKEPVSFVGVPVGGDSPQ